MPDIEQIASSVESIRKTFEQHRYICSNQIATAVYLAYHLKKPVLIEGPPGVGKTELAKTTATMFGLPLIRLQCYEGLDEAKALYEWKYGKQLLYTQVLEGNRSTKFCRVQKASKSRLAGCTSSATSSSPRNSSSRARCSRR